MSSRILQIIFSLWEEAEVKRQFSPQTSTVCLQSLQCSLVFIVLLITRKDVLTAHSLGNARLLFCTSDTRWRQWWNCEDEDFSSTAWTWLCKNASAAVGSAQYCERTKCPKVCGHLRRQQRLHLVENNTKLCCMEADQQTRKWIVQSFWVCRGLTT